MTDNATNSRLETLEFRLMHQESALEEITRSLLDQEQLLKNQADRIKDLEEQLNTLRPDPAGLPKDEIPPHY